MLGINIYAEAHIKLLEISFITFHNKCTNRKAVTSATNDLEFYSR